ncbi:unnamed protein product [Closterium sp. NIES-53]
MQPQHEWAGEEPQEQQQGQVPSQQTPEEAEQQRLRLRDLPNPAPALSLWSPTVPSCSPRPVPFLVPMDLSFPPQSYCVSRAPSSALVTHSTAPLSSVTALLTTIAGFASSHCLDYAAHLVSGPARSPSSGGAPIFPLEVLEDKLFELRFLAAAVPHLCAMLLAPKGDPDALDIPIPHNHAKAVSGPWASYWIAAEEAEIASYRSIGTYVNAVPPPGTNIVSGMWLYKVKRPPRSPPVFKACYVARGFPQRDYNLHSLGSFFTAFLQGSLHEQIWLPLDFFPSSADLSLFVHRGSTPFFVLVYILTRFRFPFSKVQLTPLAVDHGLTAPPSDESFESSGPYPELTRRSTQRYSFRLGTGVVSWRSTRASSVTISSSEAGVYVVAMAAQELRWPSFLLTDLGERPRSPPVLFADNKSTVLPCEDPRLVGKAKHIHLRYFLLRRFQQRGQALVQRVVYEANTADIFIKALPPCDHQRFCTQLGCVPARPHLLT